MPGVNNGLVVCSVFNSPILSMKKRKLPSNTIFGGVNSTNSDVKSDGNGWYTGKEIHSQSEICESINLKLR
jgi:hypothetical protein